jgi:hypothetical protein
MTTRTLQERDANMNKMHEEAKKRTAGQNCSEFLDLNYTRLEEPSRITEKPFNRYAFPIIDPKEFIFHGFNAQQFNSSTTGNVRDGRSTRYDSKLDLEKQNAELRRSANKIQRVTAINGMN